MHDRLLSKQARSSWILLHYSNIVWKYEQWHIITIEFPGVAPWNSPGVNNKRLNQVRSSTSRAWSCISMQERLKVFETLSLINIDPVGTRAIVDGMFYTEAKGKIVNLPMQTVREL